MISLKEQFGTEIYFPRPGLCIKGIVEVAHGKLPNLAPTFTKTCIHLK